GSDLRRLPFDGGARGPAWSPDGAKIAFTGYRDVGDAEIYVMNADGSSPINLTRRAGVDELPRWSRTGTHILFSTKRGGRPEIYSMRADGTGLTNITRNDVWDAMADW
ncbi:MAG: Tol-Pal system beta propeller repeat protein TolB, partial [Gemmatimonadetes bacterium]|nr:Tol-Pal system beta propeller repeat protein TolB [Gemmatimonadota bacterium]